MMNEKYNFFYYPFFLKTLVSCAFISSVLPFALPDVFEVITFQLQAHLCSNFLTGKFSATLNHNVVAELSRSEVTY